MVFRQFIAFATVCLAAPLAAQQVLVDDPQACAEIATEDGFFDFVGNGGLVMDKSGYSSLEYFCQFQPDLEFNWDGYQTTTHMGHCETPGPFFTPTLFTFLLTDEEPGVVVAFDGSEGPTRFYSCTD